MELCGPCKFLEKERRAVKYCKTCHEAQCKTCAEIHSSSKATRNHFLMRIEEINKDSKTHQDLDDFQKCKVHPEKTPEFFCTDHSHFVCSSCLLNVHKSDCKTFVDISIAGEHLTKRNFNDQVKRDLENMIDLCKEEEVKITVLKKATLRERKDIQKYLGDIRDKVMALFEKHEKQVLDGIDKDIQTQLTKLDNHHESLMKTLQTAEESRTILQSVTRSGSNADMFRCALSVIQQLNDLRVNNATVTTKAITHWVFSSPSLMTVLEDITPAIFCNTTEAKQCLNTKSSQYIANLETNGSDFLQTVNRVAFKKDDCLSSDSSNCSTYANKKDSHPKHNTFIWDSAVSSRTPAVLMRAAAVQTRSSKRIEILEASNIHISTLDDKQPKIAGITMTHQGHFVLSDSKWLRLIRMKEDFSYKDATDISHQPGNMSILNERFLVMCLPTANRIAFISVLTSDFRWTRNFKTQYAPKAVHAVDAKTLFVSMSDSCNLKWYLQLLTTDGTILQDIGITKEILDAECISSLKPSGSSPTCFLQYCKISNVVHCFEENGKEVFTYYTNSRLSSNGLYVDKKGIIFVLKSSGILQIISKDGDLLHKICIPKEANGVTWNRNMDSLVVTSPDVMLVLKYNIKME